MDRYDAELRGWWKHRINGFLVVVGSIFGDRKGRWLDARMIHRSVLLSKHVGEGVIVKTMNSKYLLVGSENAEAAKRMPESSTTTGSDAVLGPSHRIKINRTLNDALRRQIADHLRAGTVLSNARKNPFL